MSNGRDDNKRKDPEGSLEAPPSKKNRNEPAAPIAAPAAAAQIINPVPVVAAPADTYHIEGAAAAPTPTCQHNWKYEIEYESGPRDNGGIVIITCRNCGLHHNEVPKSER